MDLLSFLALLHFDMAFEMSGRKFIVVSRKTDIGSGRSIRVSGRAGHDAIGEVRSFGLYNLLVKYITYTYPKACYRATITRRQVSSKCKVQFCSIPLQLPVCLPDALYAWPRIAIDTAFWGISSWPF